MKNRDHIHIESFVHEEYPGVTQDELSELIGTALLFQHEEAGNLDGEELFAKLSAKLHTYYLTNIRQQARRLDDRSLREQRVGDLANPSYELSDEQRIEAASHRGLGISSHEIAAEIEQAAEEFERNREALKRNLPPVLFEAFERSLNNETPAYWTAGYTQRSLMKLCWRALIRIKWQA